MLRTINGALRLLLLVAYFSLVSVGNLGLVRAGSIRSIQQVQTGPDPGNPYYRDNRQRVSYIRQLAETTGFNAVARCTVAFFENFNFTGYKHEWQRVELTPSSGCNMISSNFMQEFRTDNHGSEQIFYIDGAATSVGNNQVDNIFGSFAVDCECSTTDTGCAQQLKRWIFYIAEHPLFYMDGGQAETYSFTDADCSESTCSLRQSFNSSTILLQDNVKQASMVWACPEDLESVCAKIEGLLPDSSNSSARLPVIRPFVGTKSEGPLGPKFPASTSRGCCIQCLQSAQNRGCDRWQWETESDMCLFATYQDDSPQQQSGPHNVFCNVTFVEKATGRAVSYALQHALSTCAAVSNDIFGAVVSTHVKELPKEMFKTVSKAIWQCECSGLQDDENCYDRISDFELSLWPKKDKQGTPVAVAFDAADCLLDTTCIKAVAVNDGEEDNSKKNTSPNAIGSASWCLSKNATAEEVIAECSLSIYGYGNLRGPNLRYSYVQTKEDQPASCQTLVNNMAIASSSLGKIASLEWSCTCSTGSSHDCYTAIGGSNLTVWESASLIGDSAVYDFNALGLTCNETERTCKVVLDRVPSEQSLTSVNSMRACLAVAVEQKDGSGDEGEPVVAIVLPVCLAVGLIVGLAVFAIVFRRQRTRRTTKKKYLKQSTGMTGLSAQEYLALIKASSHDQRASSSGSRKSSGPPLESLYLASLEEGSSLSSSEGGHETSSQGSMNNYVIRTAELTLCTNTDGEPIQLGKGGFSTVFKGLYKGEQVAIKVMKESNNESQNLRSLLREVAHSRRCQHKNVTRYIGAAFDGDQVLLVYEFMDGGDLFKAMQEDDKERQLSWYNRGQTIAQDIACGLAYIHSERIIHSDIKSPNIMLCSNGVAKICDMGMSKFQANAYVTKEGHMGSWAWAAPELILNSRVDEKVDVYSLGVVLWEIVTGMAPLRGQRDDPWVPDDCPAEIAALIKECTSQDPDSRPTAADVYERISLAILRTATPHSSPSASAGCHRPHQRQPSETSKSSEIV